MKICYCGYDFFSGVIEALVEQHHSIAELFTWPTDNEYDFNSKVFAVAEKQKARITMSPMRDEDLTRLKGGDVDLIIAAAYPFKIPDWTGSVRYAVNVHPSPLPEGRGPWPLPWLILKDLRENAVTVHKVAPDWDRGDIVAQEFYPISDRDTLESVSLRAQMVAAELVPRVVNDIGALWSSAVPQRSGSYWRMPKKIDRTITFDMSIAEIDRIVRAFSKFEAFVFLNGIRHFVRKVDIWPAVHNLRPGTVALSGSRETVYAVRDGFVALTSTVRADEK